MAYDSEKIDEAVLALLFLTLHDGFRAWKSFDWDAMNRLYDKGLIGDPVGKAKSVVFTEKGLRLRRGPARSYSQSNSRSSDAQGFEEIKTAPWD